MQNVLPISDARAYTVSDDASADQRYRIYTSLQRTYRVSNTILVSSGIEEIISSQLYQFLCDLQTNLTNYGSKIQVHVDIAVDGKSSCLLVNSVMCVKKF